MPRAFTDAERERIESRLIEVGIEHFERQGLRKTNIAELARAAGIGKGSFYLFFPSKEALFLAIADRFELELKAAFVDELGELIAAGVEARELLRRYFELHFEIFERHPFMAILSRPEELEALVRKISPERLAVELDKDARFFAELIAGWQAAGLVDASVDPRAVSALSRGAVALIQGRALIGEDWEAMVELLIDALAARLALAAKRRGKARRRAR